MFGRFFVTQHVLPVVVIRHGAGLHLHGLLQLQESRIEVDGLQFLSVDFLVLPFLVGPQGQMSQAAGAGVLLQRFVSASQTEGFQLAFVGFA